MRTEIGDGLVEVVRRATGRDDIELAGPPVPLTGGFWAELVRFRLADPPDGWNGELVARVMPDPATAAKETVFQHETHRQGFPTPSVLAAGGPEAGIAGQAYLVMPLVAGQPLLAGLDGVAALRRLRPLARNLPATLAQVSAGLHRLDPEGVRRRLVADGLAVPGIDAMLDHLHDTATALGRHDIAAAAAHLQAHRPPVEPDVLCHGDLHPFNVLVDQQAGTTVLDWSAAVIAPAAYDLGFTSLLLSQPPLLVPAPLRPAVAMAGRMLARRFVRAYETASGTTVDPDSLDWHQALVCVRALVEVAGWDAAGTLAERRGHPWVIAADALAARLTRRTGVEIG